jgi:hypothetical protein
VQVAHRQPGPVSLRHHDGVKEKNNFELVFCNVTTGIKKKSVTLWGDGRCSACWLRPRNKIAAGWDLMQGQHMLNILLGAMQ